MSIPIEQPPQSMDNETKAWVNRLMISIAGEFEKLNQELEELNERVEKLESKTP